MFEQVTETHEAFGATATATRWEPTAPVVEEKGRYHYRITLIRLGTGEERLLDFYSDAYGFCEVQDEIDARKPVKGAWAVIDPLCIDTQFNEF
jgi:hypothetical protein